MKNNQNILGTFVDCTMFTYWVQYDIIPTYSKAMSRCDMEEEQKLNNEVIRAINHHLETMTEEEQIMTLKYIHALKDFREVTA